MKTLKDAILFIYWSKSYYKEDTIEGMVAMTSELFNMKSEQVWKMINEI